MSVDAQAFKNALSEFVSGVTVVTTFLPPGPSVAGGALGVEGAKRVEGVEAAEPGADGRFGMTVSAFSSVSLSPPLVLVCLANPAATHEALRKAGVFAVNILAQGQADLAMKFAARGPMADRFQGVALESGTGNLPLLAEAVVAMECRVVAAHPGGDHTIVVGAVERVVSGQGHDGLVYGKRAFRALGEPLG